ncbi:MAG: LuxR C-terminal-related transcriptional regulator [Myxococcales bacterium]|jgi:two-component system nitrate/nitrite response regulator NarL
MRHRVLIAHPEPDIRRILCEQVEGARQHLLGCVESDVALRTLVREEHPDVVLVEVSMLQVAAPWLDAERERTALSLPCVAISDRADDEALDAAARAGSCGYLVVPCGDAQLRAMLAMAANLGACSHPTRPRSGTFAIGLDARPTGAKGQGALSAREREVYEYLRAGVRIAEIATRLYISPHTVRKHAQAVFRKLGVHSQVELMCLNGERRRRSTPY